MPIDINNKEQDFLILSGDSSNRSILPEDYRSQEVNDIISERPGFWGTWSLPIFLVILLLIVAGTWFIRYPDTIMATATLTATNGPREIISRREGKLTNLFVQTGDIVSQGQPIGWIESTAGHAEILKLSAFLNTAIDLLNENKTESVSSLFAHSLNDLGELQPAYQQFITAWQQFNDYLVNGFYYKKKNILEQDLAFLKQNEQALTEQLSLTKKSLALGAQDYEANKTLYAKKVLSAKDYRAAQNTYIDKQLSIPQLNQALAANENQQVDKQGEIDQLEHTISQQKEIFAQALHTLKSQVTGWISQYIMTAPVSGRVMFLIPLQKNQFLQANQVLGYVNPADSKYYARVNFTQENFGKADTGQEVQLRVNAYPYEQFGYISGKLNYISSVATDSGFLGNVVLPHGLTTVYNHPIQFRNGLKVQAVIITKQMRLLQRFYYNMMKKVNR
ncbi:MAG: HlyD family efflux transporter periplasmic adaptor subunit [Chitinophagaceae bacterium]|nr:MAG: HlyD family efflux transporter periplasmic adaptor subunit [Chitinophagaceae bacterium]